MAARDAISYFKDIAIATGLRPSSQLSDRRIVQKEPVEEEQREPQTHQSVRIDAAEDPAVALVDDDDFADMDFSERRVVRAARRTQSGQLGL